jgi:flagellar biosynthetic protein FlhB
MAADDDEKTEDPTPKRLEDARKRGDIIYSAETGAFLALLSGYALLQMAPMLSGSAAWMARFFELPHTLASDPGALQRLAADVSFRLLLVIGVIGAVTGAAALAARYAQDRPTLTASKLAPKLEKLDPLKGFKRLVGPQGLANLLKGLAKMLLVGGAAGAAAWSQAPDLVDLPQVEAPMLLVLARESAAEVLAASLAVFVLVAGADYLWTRREFMQKLKMSRKEIRDEAKDTEGDPNVRGRLRRLRMERARKRMMQQVPKATVVITNPTHYAVALRYVAGETAAPVCLAKGVDAVALRIREIAREANVPIVEDPPLARALHAAADLDAPIPREHFEAVAKVIGFVMRLAQQRRSARRPNRP